MYESPTKFTAHNDITGDLLINKSSSKAYEDNLQVIIENNKKHSGLSCEDCSTMCMFPERKQKNDKCSFFEATFFEGAS